MKFDPNHKGVRKKLEKGEGVGAKTPPKFEHCLWMTRDITTN